MRAKALIAVGIVSSLLAIASVAWGSTVTTVTIRATSTSALTGRVFNKTASCRYGRSIIVFKQTGHSQDPSKDKQVATATSMHQGTRNFGVWKTSTTVHHGQYYAEATAHASCRAGFSKTITVP